MLLCKGLGGRVISKGVLKDGLYQLEDTAAIKNPEVFEESKTGVNLYKDSLLALNLSNVQFNSVVSKHIWHRRLGHPSSSVFEFIVKNRGLSVKDNEKSEFCSSCQLGKSHSLPFPISNSRASKPLELVHSDV